MKLNHDNWQTEVLNFRDRQAGVAVVHEVEDDDTKYTYNAYCIETTVMKELWSEEFKFLDDALDKINSEFDSWEILKLNTKADSGCGSCAAK